MPATTSIGSYTLSNLGPLTTTFTPAPSCSTKYWGFEVDEILQYSDEEVNSANLSTSSVLVYYGSPCEETAVSRSGCIPSGSAVDDYVNSLASALSGGPVTQEQIEYYSPGVVCPSGYETVGVAAKSSGGAVSSSGAAFIPPVSSYTDSRVQIALYDPAPNAVLEAMLEGESAILCCPSGYTVNPDGECRSTLTSYPLPSEVCVEVVNADDIEYPYPTTTMTIYGSVYTGEAVIITGTAKDPTLTEKVASTTASGSGLSRAFVAVDVVDVLYLVHAASDTASADSSAKGNRVALSTIMMPFALVLAFTSGFITFIM